MLILRTDACDESRLEVLRAELKALGLITLSHEDCLIEHSLQARLPLLTTREEATAADAVLSYSTNGFENFRRTPELVDKIPRGA